MGSVKDLEIVQKPSKAKTGVGRFHFSDRYSVFDWGKMPDEIPHKGEALCLIGAYFFEKLKDFGIPSHYKGLLEDGKVLDLKSLKNPSSVMEIKLVRVIKPLKDKKGNYYYENFKEEEGNFLIPLEIIFRNCLPENSSFVQRIKSGQILLSEYGLTQIPPASTILKNPILDFSTKLEPTDRYLKEMEAFEISGLNEEEFQKLKEITHKINNMITEEVSKFGLVHIDGKIEMALDQKRNLMIVDVFGTPDECRFFMDGFHLSKEVARVFYRKTDWYEEINLRKSEDRDNWKEKVKTAPPKLPKELLEGISNLYTSFCNELTGRVWFEDVPPLKDVLKNLRNLIN
jgi:phosphoribosylaminoimidazole-succinocarboxamide synthase